jgi:hypothetical protein
VFLNSFKMLLSCFLLIVFLTACSPSNDTKSPVPGSLNTKTEDKSWKDGFPAHWWKEFPRANAKSWEILPQDAGPNEVVLSKRNELGLLSNFADTSFVFHGVCYPTVEAFWQMMKYPENSDDLRWTWARPWKYTRQQVSQMNGYAAKSAGNYANFLMEKNNANWITFEGKAIPFATKEPKEHYDLVWHALIEKVRQNPEVLQVLMATKELKLIPDHSISERSPREWHYNLLWMDIRKLVDEKNLDLKTQEDMNLKTCVGTK